MEKSVFEVLNAIDCSEHIEKKNGLTYLSWAWAWQILKKHYPASIYTIYEDALGRNYHTDGRTCWVKTGVTVEGIEHIEYLPVMDFRNASILVDKVTSFDVNKAIQRSLTKAVARHGLGLYIYAGEDLPDAADDEKRPAATKPVQAAAPQPKPIDIDTLNKYIIGHAQGKKTKSGKTYRQGYIDSFSPTQEMIQAFDDAVVDYKTTNNLV
ncbi:MAG: DUF1071 domain-containing protein [Bacteroidales bacterium]|nr:DUF1071 domain-containing protein [Bacteroidales bacterium]